MSIDVGQRLGHYQILDLIGVGGMGEVYRAQDVKLERQVAVKVLTEELASDGERLERFRREAKLLASLNHPGIATLHGLEEFDGVPFLVMELVDGETFEERLASGPVEIPALVVLFRQIAEALEEAHDQGVLHRDLKPANIKITPTGTIKLLDFGLAKVYDRGRERAPVSSELATATRATAFGTIMGTPAYMSPEQARGHRVDRRTDIWAFGCMFYEALSGRRAFPGDNVTDILAMVVGSEPDWTALPELSPALERLLRRCLRKDPRQRLRDIGDARLELLGDLSSAHELHGEDPVRPRRSLVWIGLAALVVLTTGGLLGIGFERFGIDSMAAPVTYAQIVLPPDQVLSQMDRAVAFSPDGRFLAYSTEDRLYQRALDRPESVPIPGSEGGRSPFFSTDGKWIGFWAGGQLKKVARDRGSPINLCSAYSLYGASWSPEDRIVFGQGSSGIFEVPAEGGEPKLLVRPDPAEGEVSFYGPQLLPGGELLLFTLLEERKNWNGARIVVQRLTTGERETLIEGGTDARYVSSGHLVFGREATLMATALDLRTLRIQGPEVPIQNGVWRAMLWETGASEFSVSTTGSLVYIQDPPAYQRVPVWVDREGKEEPLSMQPRFYMHPRLSPDGRTLVVDTIDTMDLWLYEVERAATTRLTVEKTHLHPIWSADGSRVIFDASQGHALHWKAVGETEPSQLLVRDDAHLLTPISAAPDGRALAVELSNYYVDYNIAILPLEGDREPQPLLDSPEFRETAPMFSPDGRFLAFVSDETGANEVYVQPYPGPGRRWLISRGGGTEPVWSPTGRELFYRTGDAMMAVRLRMDGEFTVGTPRKLFEAHYSRETISAHPAYDVSRDGERFLMVKDLAPPTLSHELQLVFNWLELVKQRVPHEP